MINFHQMPKTVHRAVRFVRYVLTSGAGTVVDTAVLWCLSHFIFNTYVGEYIVSPIISFECAVLTNFTLYFFLIWKDRIRRYTLKTFFRKYGVYNASATAVFLIKIGILLLIELFTGWNVVLCNIIALCFSGLINFSMNEWVIFRKQT